MTSLRTTANPDHFEAHSSAARDSSARLSLKPSTSARGALDGAWWPRSTNSAIELAALIKALGVRRVPVRRIALIRAGWDSAPRRIRLGDGRRVPVDWFRTGDLRTIRIVGTDDQRIALLIIPVDTKQAIAQLALTVAADGQDPDITAPASQHFVPEASLDNEGGVLDHRGQHWASSAQPSDVVGRRRIVLLPHGRSLLIKSMSHVPDRKKHQHGHGRQDQDLAAAARRTS